MLICARAYHEEENKSHIAPKIFCSLSGCYCVYVVWKQGRNDQSDKCIECPRYERIDDINDKVKRDPVPCLMTMMVGKEKKNLTDKQAKRINKRRKALRDYVIAQGMTIIEIDAFSWRIGH